MPSSTRRLVWAFAFCATLAAQSPSPDADKTLRLARTKIQLALKRLPAYSCTQTVDHEYLEPMVRRQRSCQEIAVGKLSTQGILEIRAKDRIRFEALIADGRETHSWVDATRFDSRQVDEVAGKNPIGTGPWKDLLHDIFNGNGTRFTFLKETEDDERRRLVYRFESSQSGWEGEIELDRQTANLKRLSVRKGPLPAETQLCDTKTAIEYADVRLGKGEFALPAKIDQHVVHQDGSELEIRTVVANWREPLKTPPGAKATGSTGAPVTAGIAVKLRLTVDIDSRLAAAGDRITASVAQAVRDEKTGAIILPEGALVSGCLTRVEQIRQPSRVFLVALRFEAVMVDGVEHPIGLERDRGDELQEAKARMQRPGPGMRPGMRRIGQPLPVRAVTTPGEGGITMPDQLVAAVLRAGLETRWVTVEPKPTANVK